MKNGARLPSRRKARPPSTPSVKHAGFRPGVPFFLHFNKLGGLPAYGGYAAEGLSAFSVEDKHLVARMQAKHAAHVMRFRAGKFEPFAPLFGGEVKGMHGGLLK